MKKSKQFTKGKHIYIKSGNKMEVRTVKEESPLEVEFDGECPEVYVDQFKFEVMEQGIKVLFGKLVFGMDQIIAKRAVLISRNTAKRMVRLVEDALKNFPD